MAEPRHDRRHDKAKPIEQLVTIEPGTLGAFVLAYLDDLCLHNYSRHTPSAARACTCGSFSSGARSAA